MLGFTERNKESLLFHGRTTIKIKTMINIAVIPPKNPDIHILSRSVMAIPQVVYGTIVPQNIPQQKRV
jgi:hypothetical protein